MNYLHIVIQFLLNVKYFLHAKAKIEPGSNLTTLTLTLATFRCLSGKKHIFQDKFSPFLDRYASNMPYFDFLDRLSRIACTEGLTGLSLR
jgi:hypothetical protein